MAGETSDSGKGCDYDPNPNQSPEPSENGDGPIFLSRPTFYREENVIRFKVRGRPPIKIILFFNGITVQEDSRYDEDAYVEYGGITTNGTYTFQLIDSLGKKTHYGITVSGLRQCSCSII